jgi:hypothetical protein
MRGYQAKLALVLLIAFSGICLMGCSRPVPTMKDVEGKWLAIKKENYALGGGEAVGFTIEFSSDKTVMLPSGKANWNILKDGRIEIVIPGMTMHGELEKDIMTVTMPEGKGKVIFKKQ